jgi:MYXO-CTERM domain-containing protein
MSSQFNELGTGVSSTYYTQDFGSGSAPSRAMAMGVHLPLVPQQAPTVDLAVVLEGPNAPDAVYAVVDGERLDLETVIGEDDRGVYAAEYPNSAGCHAYYFVLEAGDFLETFPETGSYGWGGCPFDDAEAGWLASQDPLPGSPDEEPGSTGTSGTTGTDGTGPGGTTPDGASAGPTEPIKDVGGCACSASPTGAAGWLLVPLVGLARRRSPRR